MKGLNKTFDIVRLGLHSLTVHIVRSILTALGIIIGVCSVIIMLAVNEGAGEKARETLRQLGSNNIIINTVKLPEDESQSGGAGRQILAYGMRRADVARILGSVPDVELAVVVHRSLKDTTRLGKKLTVAVIATEPSYIHVAQTDVIAGRFINAVDMEREMPHCVITSSLARRLFAYAEPIGQTLMLHAVGGRFPFTVVGVIRRLPATLAGRADDVGSNVIVPLSASQSRLGEISLRQTASGFEMEKVEVSQLILKMPNEQEVLNGAAIARGLLQRYHTQGDYEVVVPLELIAQQKEQMRLWNMVSFVIAAVSLVVGGIGIMNIMLASVTERTREIGVRRALGAKRQDIVVQFLVESITLTTVGGLVGIGIGLGLPFLVERWLDFATRITSMTLVLPFVMAVAVGLVSGLYPALRAAGLDPIVALRHE